MCWTSHYSGWDEHITAPPSARSRRSAASPASINRRRGRSEARSRAAAVGQECCFIALAISLPSLIGKGGKRHGGGSVMELRTESPRKYVQTRLVNHCAQCGETIFLPEWSEYMDRQRVRHLWECEACGYKFETLVSFPDP